MLVENLPVHFRELSGREIVVEETRTLDNGIFEPGFDAGVGPRSIHGYRQRPRERTSGILIVCAHGSLGNSLDVFPRCPKDKGPSA